MKKITVLLISICLVSISVINAQTNKGRVLLGVSSAISLSGSGPNILSLGYSTTTKKSDAPLYIESDPDKNLSVNLLPRFGFFIFNNFALGADICIGYYNFKNGALKNESTQTIFGGGPFIRFYFPTQKVRPFLESSATFGSQQYKFKSDDGSSDINVTSFITSFGAGLGLAAPIGEKTTFDIMASYNSTTSKYKEDNPDNDRYITGNIGIRLGFTLYLGSEF
jgi:hypothetical protein